MTLDELQTLIANAAWFSNLGKFTRRDTMIPIRLVRASEQFQVVLDFDTPDGPDLQVEWEWLPTSKDQIDPVHGQSLRDRARELGKEQDLQAVTLVVYKLTLTSLQNTCQHPLLKVSHHDSTNSAKAAALYEVRMATAEIVVSREGFWCSLMPLYAAGYWPRGLTKRGDLLVF